MDQAFKQLVQECNFTAFRVERLKSFASFQMRLLSGGEEPVTRCPVGKMLKQGAQMKLALESDPGAAPVTLVLC